MIRFSLLLVFFFFSVFLMSCSGDQATTASTDTDKSVKTESKKPVRAIKTRENTLAGFKDNMAVLGNGQMVEVPGLADEKQSVFILVRHAEKESSGDDPALNLVGQERAKRLADILKNIPLNQIMSTDYVRTKTTVEPLSAEKKLVVQMYDPSSQTDLFTDISVFNKHNVMVVGHSNTIPGLANFLIGKPVFDDFSENDYDQIIIISAEQPGKASYLSLNY